MQNIYLIKSNFLWSDRNMCTYSHTHKCAHTYTKHTHVPTHIYQGQLQIVLKRGANFKGERTNLLFGLENICWVAGICTPPPSPSQMFNTQTNTHISDGSRISETGGTNLKRLGGSTNLLFGQLFRKTTSQLARYWIWSCNYHCFLRRSESFHSTTWYSRTHHKSSYTQNVTRSTCNILFVYYRYLCTHSLPRYLRTEG